MKKGKEVRLTDEQYQEFKEFVRLCDYYKNAYFWTPPSSAGQRRSIEKRDYVGYGCEIDGVTYWISFSVSCSCRNYYVSKSVYRDGKKTTVTVIKTLLRKDIAHQQDQEQQRVS